MILLSFSLIVREKKKLPFGGTKTINRLEPFDKGPTVSGDKPEIFGMSLKIVTCNIVT